MKCFVAGVIAVALLPCGVGSAAASREKAPRPTEQHALVAYLAAVKPLFAKYSAALRLARDGLQDLEPANLGNDEILVSSTAKLTRAVVAFKSLAPRFRQVRAPSELSEAHSVLAPSMTLSAQWLAPVASAKSWADLIRAPDTSDLAQEAIDRQVHWRQETTVILRRARIPLPFWLTQVGK